LSRHFRCPPKIANRLVNLSRRHRLLYVAVPKSACSILLGTLQWLEVDGEERLLPADPHNRLLSPLVSPFADIKLFEEGMNSNSFLRFSFVRNPFARALSCYLDKVRGRSATKRVYLPKLGAAPSETISFADFLRRIARQPRGMMDVHWAPQAFLLSPASVTYHFVGRVERLETDLARLLSRRGLEVPSARDIGHATGASRLLHDYYGAEEIALVREIYAEDFAAFGYERDLAAAAGGRAA
jgi:hypothetical protein